MLGIVVFFTALDQTVVITALLPMSMSLGVTTQDLPALSWVISGFLLGYVIVMPLMGRVADIWGRRKMMFICLAVFSVGSIMCVEAPRLAQLWDFSHLNVIGINPEHPALAWMITARFIQAVGGGAIVPIALATSGSLFSAAKRSVALGFITGVTEAGGALGPLYGAIILEKWPLLVGAYTEPWMWLFLLNLPIIAILCLLIWWLWPKTSRVSEEESLARSTSQNPASTTEDSRSVDWLGAIVLGAALLCLSVGLSQQAGAMIELPTEEVAANNPYLLAGAVVLTLLFIAIERKHKAPLIPLELFRSPIFSASAILSLLVGIILIAALVNVPIFAYAVLGKTHLAAGLLLLRLTIFIPIGAFLSGLMVARFGARATGALSAIVMAGGCYLIGQWTPESSEAFMTLGTFVTGFGFGLALAPISTTALQTVSSNRFGIAAAVSTSMRMIGMILGLAALSTWEIRRFQQLFAELRNTPPPPGCDFVCIATRMESSVKLASSQAMAETFLAAAAVAGLAIVVSLFLGNSVKGQKTAL